MRSIIAIATILAATPAGAQCFPSDYGCQHRQNHDRTHELHMQLNNHWQPTYQPPPTSQSYDIYNGLFQPTRPVRQPRRWIDDE